MQLFVIFLPYCAYVAVIGIAAIVTTASRLVLDVAEAGGEFLSFLSIDIFVLEVTLIIHAPPVQ